MLDKLCRDCKKDSYLCFMFLKKKKPNPYKEANEAFLQVKAQEEGKAQKADSRRRMVPRFQPVTKEEALKEIQINPLPINEMHDVTKLTDITTDGIRSTSFATCGVTCSTRINQETEGDIIRRVEIVKGCDGNTKGVARLCEGRKVQDVIGMLEGINCKGRGTSCPDQLAKALKAL